MQRSLTGLAEFVAVVETGGFTAAARRLGSTKSLLSDRVRDLEIRLGQKLLHRTTRRLGLTEAGRIYYEYGRRIFDEIAAASGALEALKGEPSGLLRIGTTVNFASLYIAKILPAFRSRYPAVSVEIATEETFSDIVAEGIDVAIRFGPVDKMPGIARRFFSISYLLCAAPGYLERYGTPSHQDDLHRHTCFSFTSNPAWSEWHLRRGAEIVTVRTSGTLRTNNGTVSRALVLAGNGIGLMNHRAVADEIRSGEVVEVLPDWTLDGIEKMGMCILLADNQALLPKVRAFLDFISADLGSPLPA